LIVGEDKAKYTKDYVMTEEEALTVLEKDIKNNFPSDIILKVV